MLEWAVPGDADIDDTRIVKKATPPLDHRAGAA
jgi:hypothetical protein